MTVGLEDDYESGAYIDPFMSERDASNVIACNRQLTLSKQIYHIVILVSIYFDNIFNFIIYCILGFNLNKLN